MSAGLFAPEMLPFAVALGLMLLIAALEVIGLLFGHSPSHTVDTLLPDHDAHAGLHGHGHTGGQGPDGLLTWLGIGRVPLLMLLVVFLCGFGLSGYALQNATMQAVGWPLHPALASLGALAAALPVTRAGGLLLAKLLPNNETEAVSHQSFVGQIATVTHGTARRGLPAEAKLRDRFGRTHYIRIEPDLDGAELQAGTQVLVLRQQGAIFRANPHGVSAQRTRQTEIRGT
jgi:hypothetical protein